MLEIPVIIKMNIAHYDALLKLNARPEQRAIIEQLLAEAQIALVQATQLPEQQALGEKP